MILHFDPEHIDCDSIRKFLYDYVERDLDPRLLMAMDNHVLACEKCEVLVQSYKLASETTRYTMKREEKIPDDCKDKILRRLYEEPED